MFVLISMTGIGIHFREADGAFRFGATGAGLKRFDFQGRVQSFEVLAELSFKVRSI